MPKPAAPPSLKWTGTKGNDEHFVASVDALKRTTYDGGAGYDTFNLSGLTTGVTISMNLNNPGTSRVWADSPFHGSWWTYIGSKVGPVIDNTIKNFEKIVGTNFNDYFEFNSGTVARVVDAGGGNDAIRMGGSAGTSTMIGGLGSDQLFGSPNSVLVGGTYNGGSAPGDDTQDTFTMYSGTILDFEVGVDKLYFDVPTTNAVWVNVVTSYGAGARLTMSADSVVTVIGVDAATMNAIPIGYVKGPWGGPATSGAGDDFMMGLNTFSADDFIFPAGSGHDEMVGYELGKDRLIFANAPTFSEASYNGDTALLATYDGGASSVLLIGLGLSDVPSLQIDILA